MKTNLYVGISKLSCSKQLSSLFVIKVQFCFQKLYNNNFKMIHSRYPKVIYNTIKIIFRLNVT